MPFRIRNRYRNESGYAGSSLRTRRVFYQYMADWVSDYDHNGRYLHNHSLNAYTFTTEGSHLGGKVRFTTFKQGCPSSFADTSIPEPWPVFDETEQDFYSRMVAGTAPFRSSFSVPTFVGELKDMPGLIRYGFRCASWLVKNFKDLNPRRWLPPAITAATVVNKLGYSIGSAPSRAKRLATANLAIQFGFAPFVSDVSSILGLATELEKRRREMAKLEGSGRITRRWELPDWTGPEETATILLSSLGSLYGPRTIRYTAKRWCVVTFYVTRNTLLPKTDSDLLRMALGLSSSGVLLTAWELLPWSWLADYFSNIGDVLQATANAIQFQIVGNVMTTKTAHAMHPFCYKNDPSNLIYGLSCSSGHITKVWKQRAAFTGIPSVTFFGDLLSPKQLSILGSLATIKGLAK